MSKRFLRSVCIQTSAGSDPEKNIIRIEKLFKKASALKPDLIALPENFIWRGASENLKEIAARAKALTERFSGLARLHRTAVLLGSLIEPAGKSGKYYNTSILIAKSGRVIARYRKIHLFQIKIKRVKTDEARHILRGNQPVIGKAAGVSFALSICFDLRFPELYRNLVLRGVRVLLVPSNFTYVTGAAHWEILLRARAIENQCFVVAPAQSGVNPESGIKSFGTSLIIDPWGKVLARASSEGEELIWADLDLRAQGNLRRDFPVLKSRIL